MQAKDVMTTAVVTVKPDTPVAEIAQRLVDRRISAVPVVDDEDRVVGIVSEGDLMHRPEVEGRQHPSWWLSLVADPAAQALEYVKAHGSRARDVMTRDVVTVHETASIEEIASLLERRRIKRVPVVRDSKVVGIVSRANLLHGLVARRHEASPSVDDRKLREQVETSIRESGARTGFVNVVVSGGVVQLWGAAHSDAEREAIDVAAAGVAGVRRVENNLGLLSPMLAGMMGAQ